MSVVHDYSAPVVHDLAAIDKREVEDGEVSDYMARRMAFLGYEVSAGILVALSDADGMVPHRVLVGIQGPGLEGREFPWPLVMEKTQVSRERVPSYWQSTKRTGVEISTANAIVWTLAQVALGAGFAE